MNDNYKWNGVTFNSMGIIIEETPIIPKPKKSFTKYVIPGKSGYTSIDNKTYDELPFTLKCHFKDGVGNRDEIAAWLDGYGTLQVDADKEYKGYISNSISFQQVFRFRKFPIQFMLQPIGQAVEPTTISSTTSTTFTSDTYTDAFPIIKVTGSGTITINLNGIQFSIYNASGEYVLDCGAKVITNNGSNASNSMSGDFPKVISGSNALTVTGTVTALTIEYKKSYL